MSRINSYQITASNPGTVHEVIFAIKQRNVDIMVDKLNDIANPKSVNYARYLTRAEVGEMSSKPESTNAVVEFLQMINDIQSVTVTPYGELIKAVATLSTWENIFNCKFEYFTAHKSTFLAVRRLFLPTQIADHVVTVFGTTQGAVGSQRRTRPETFMGGSMPTWMQSDVVGSRSMNDLSSLLSSAIQPSSAFLNTPAVLNELYAVPSNDGRNFGSQSVFETINETFSRADLTQFQTSFSLPLQQPSTIIGGHVDEGPCGGGFGNCGEANLDIQFIMAMAQSIPTTYWYDTNGLTSWLFNLTSQTNPPLINSISYLEAEFKIASSDASAFDTEAVKFGLMGLTLFAASGDGGAPGQFVESEPQFCGYMPSWPQTSKYVTAVGATQGYPEVVCSSGTLPTSGSITSGGGFSNLYPTASFQSDVVKRYFSIAETPFQNYTKTGVPFGTFNASGRGYPDISLQGAYYPVVINGTLTPVAGTSASTPVFAAMVSLINAARIEAGMNPVGWLNPALYLYADLFVNDITEGNNSCMEFKGTFPIYCCQEGFFAAPGWDATTGLGTVNFTSFYSVFVTDMLPVQPTAGPTTHHNSPTGKYFGIACAVFLFGVAMFTYIYNMSALHALVCGKKFSSDLTIGNNANNEVAISSASSAMHEL